MKAKITAKKVLSVMLAVLMIFSVVSISASAVVEYANCPHDLGDLGWVTIQEPTCRSSGIMEKWCVDCKDFVHKTIPQDMDKHVPGLWTVITPHTCSQNGYEVIYCVNGCTEQVNGISQKIILDKRVIPAHSFKVLYSEDPTCMKGGYTFSMCTDCYEMKTENYDKLEEGGHKLSEWQVVKEGTCTSDAVLERYCLNYDATGVTRCGYYETTTEPKPDNHVNVTWSENPDEIVEPTCEAEGYKPGVCNDCGAELRKPLPKHSYSEYEVVSRIESTCSTHGVEHRRCKGKIVDGVYVPCGLEYDVELELEPENHVYTKWEISKQPGCLPGERVKRCKYHYDVEIKEALPATGEHKYGEWVTVEEATCSLTGIREKTCTVCNGTVDGGKITENTPVKHDFASWKTVTKMNCNEDFLQNGEEIAYCDKCAYSKTFVIPAAHSFSDWTVAVKANCRNDQAGTMKRVCSGCGKTETKEYYAEHDFTVWAVSDMPICGGDKLGKYARMCKICDKVEEKIIPAEHEYEIVEVISYPTSEKAGLRIEKCKFCEKEVEADFACEHIVKSWEVSPAEAGSNHSEIRKGTCVACGAEVTESVHEYGPWEGFKCGEISGEITRSCTVCGESETKAMDSSHPNAVSVSFVPACMSTGYTLVQSCPDCGVENKVCDIVPALGHDFDDSWTTRVEPSCSSSGSRYKACSRCDYLQFEFIDKAAHTLIQLEAGVDPTCLLSGKTPVTYCGVCRAHFPAEDIPALGHTYAEGGEVCLRCYAYAGSALNCDCACHSTTGMENIFFKIIVKIYQMFGINQQCKCGELHYDEPGFFAKLFGKG